MKRNLEHMSIKSCHQIELELLIALLNNAERGAWAFALTNTVALRTELVGQLKARLTIPCYEFRFSEAERNPLHYLGYLPQNADEDRATIFFYDIERAFPEALGYLDLNREWFLQQPHALVFWISHYARHELAHKAPNFWSRRHSVFDFSLPERASPRSRRGETAGDHLDGVDRADWQRKLRLYRGLLKDYRADPHPDLEIMAGLYHKIATLYYQRGHYTQAETNLRQELSLRERNPSGRS